MIIRQTSSKNTQKYAGNSGNKLKIINKNIKNELLILFFVILIMEAVYIVHTREFINAGQNVYKIGRTSQLHTKRADSYPKGSIIKMQISVIDSRAVETRIIAEFKDQFHIRRDLGAEYFEGNFHDMRILMLKIICLCENVDRDESISSINADANVPTINHLQLQAKYIKLQENNYLLELNAIHLKSEHEEFKRATNTPPMLSQTLTPTQIYQNEINFKPNNTNTQNNKNLKICKRCNKEFTTNAKLNLHINRKNPCRSPELTLTPRLNFQCTRCTKRFANNHKLTCHINRQYPCELTTLQHNECDLFKIIKQECNILKLKNKLIESENEILKLRN